MTTHIQRLRSRNADDGSILLVLLFTIMITGLVIAITAVVIGSLTKSVHTRDYLLEQEAANTAVNDAVLKANLSNSNYFANPQQTYSDSGTSGPNGIIDWNWTATAPSTSTRAIWALTITTKSKITTRTFTAQLRGFEVQGARQDNTSGTITYEVDPSYVFTDGFSSTAGFSASGAVSFNLIWSPSSGAPRPPTCPATGSCSPAIAADGIVNIGSNTPSEIDLWNTGANPYNRCIGSGCSGRVQSISAGFNYDPNLVSANCDAATAELNGAWTASSGVPLTPNTCYYSMTFDTNTTLPVGSEYSYSNITIDPGITVNAGGDAYYSRLFTNGNMTMGTGAQAVAALYAPRGTCTINGTTGSGPATAWYGAFTCNGVNITDSVALYYDNYFIDSSGTSSPWVYSSLGLQSNN